MSHAGAKEAKASAKRLTFLSYLSTCSGHGERKYCVQGFSLGWLGPTTDKPIIHILPKGGVQNSTFNAWQGLCEQKMHTLPDHANGSVQGDTNAEKDCSKRVKTALPALVMRSAGVWRRNVVTGYA